MGIQRARGVMVSTRAFRVSTSLVRQLYAVFNICICFFVAVGGDGACARERFVSHWHDSTMAQAGFEPGLPLSKRTPLPLGQRGGLDRGADEFSVRVV